MRSFFHWMGYETWFYCMYSNMNLIRWSDDLKIFWYGDVFAGPLMGGRREAPYLMLAYVVKYLALWLREMPKSSYESDCTLQEVSKPLTAFKSFDNPNRLQIIRVPVRSKSLLSSFFVKQKKTKLKTISWILTQWSKSTIPFSKPPTLCGCNSLCLLVITWFIH